jgi:hypothetical protein
VNLAQMILEHEEPQETSSPGPGPLPEAQILTLREMLAAHRREWRAGDIVRLRRGCGGRENVEDRPMIVLEVVGDMPRCVDPRTIGSQIYGSHETVRALVYAENGWRALTWEPWQLIDWDGPLPEKEETPPVAQGGQRTICVGDRFLTVDGVEMEHHYFFSLDVHVDGRRGEIVEELLNLGDRVRRRVLRVHDGVETVVAEWVLPS